MGLHIGSPRVRWLRATTRITALSIFLLCHLLCAQCLRVKKWLLQPQVSYLWFQHEKAGWKSKGDHKEACSCYTLAFSFRVYLSLARTVHVVGKSNILTGHNVTLNGIYICLVKIKDKIEGMRAQLCSTLCDHVDSSVLFHQTLSLGLSRQEYWNGLPFLPPGDLPDSGIEPESPAWYADSLPLSHLWSPHLSLPAVKSIAIR